MKRNSLGVLCLSPRQAQLWANEDRATLAPLFAEVRESVGVPPRCDVLLIYGDIEVKGQFSNTKAGLREIIRDSGAKVVVVASENPGKHYIAAGRQTGYGLANLVMTLGRKGNALATFLRQLFVQMQQGVPMPQAWVALAPQSPHQSEALPETIFACELGQVVLGPSPRAI